MRIQRLRSCYFRLAAALRGRKTGARNLNIHQESAVQSFVSRRARTCSRRLRHLRLPECLGTQCRSATVALASDFFSVTFILPSHLSVCYRLWLIPHDTNSSQPRLPGEAVPWKSAQGINLALCTLERPQRPGPSALQVISCGEEPA